MEPMFTNTCLEEIEATFMPFTNENFYKFTATCYNKLAAEYLPNIDVLLFEKIIDDTYRIQPPAFTSEFNERVELCRRYIYQVLHVLNKERTLHEERLSVIKQLRKYGVDMTKSETTYSLASLKQWLEDLQKAEQEAEACLKDKKTMQLLVNWEVGGFKGCPVKLSYYAMEFIRPKLKKYVYEEKVNREALRRIETIKQERKQKEFEDAVKKRMAELGY